MQLHLVPLDEDLSVWHGTVTRLWPAPPGSEASRLVDHAEGVSIPARDAATWADQHARDISRLNGDAPLPLDLGLFRAAPNERSTLDRIFRKSTGKPGSVLRLRTWLTVAWLAAGPYGTVDLTINPERAWLAPFTLRRPAVRRVRAGGEPLRQPLEVELKVDGERTGEAERPAGGSGYLMEVLQRLEDEGMLERQHPRRPNHANRGWIRPRRSPNEPWVPLDAERFHFWRNPDDDYPVLISRTASDGTLVLKPQPRASTPPPQTTMSHYIWAPDWDEVFVFQHRHYWPDLRGISFESVIEMLTADRWDPDAVLPPRWSDGRDMRTFVVPAQFFRDNWISQMTAEQILVYLAVLAQGLDLSEAVTFKSRAAIARSCGLSPSAGSRALREMTGQRLLVVEDGKSAGKTYVRIGRGPKWSRSEPAPGFCVPTNTGHGPRGGTA